MTSLRACEFAFDPALPQHAIAEWLQAEPANTAAPAGENTVLVHREGTVVETVDISGLEKQFLTDVNLDALQSSLASQMDKFKSHLGDIPEYTVQLSDGSPLELPVSEHEVSVFCATNKQDEDYFDLEMIAVEAGSDGADDTITIADYSNTTAGGATHSSDIGSLLHTLRLRDVEGSSTTYLIAAVGFRNKCLYTFTDQLPSVVIVNHVTRTCTVIPCSIARVDVGDSTLTVLAAMRCCRHRGGSPDHFDVTALPRPCNVEGVDTGGLTGSVRVAVRDAIAQFEAQIAPPPLVEPAAVGQPDTAAADTPTDPDADTDTDPAADADPAAVATPTSAPLQTFPLAAVACIYAVENGLDPVTAGAGTIRTADEQRLTVHFGAGLEFATGEAAADHQREPSVVNLPCLFGPMRGGPALALGTPHRTGFAWADFHRTLNQVGVAVVELSTNWRQTVGGCVSTRANAIFIINCAEVPENDEVANVELVINTVNRTGTVMAGPNAIILVRLPDGKVVWYRGVRWPGLFDTCPEYCADVTETLSQLAVWVEATGGMASLPFPVVVPAGASAVWIAGTERPTAEIAALYAGASFADLTRPEFQLDLQDVCTQLCGILLPDELRTFSATFRETLTALVDSQTVALREEMQELAKHLLEDPAARHRYGVLRGQVRAVAKQVKVLAGAIDSMISTHGSSTKSSDIHRLARQETVAERADAAKRMTKDDAAAMFESIEDWCIATMDTTVLQRSLESIQARTFKSVLAGDAATAAAAIASPHPTCLELDGCTVQALMIQSREQTEHPLSSDVGVSFPSSLGDVTTSALPIPIFERFVDMRNPGEIHWGDILTEDEKCAAWRTLVVRNLIMARCSRKLKLNEDDFQISFLIAHVLLCVMEAIVSRIADVRSLDWDDTTPRMMRGLFGILLATLASGKAQPCSKLWQMVKRNSKMAMPAVDEYWIATRMLAVFRYTKWSTTNMYKNGTILFVKTIRRSLTDPLTDGLRKSVPELRKQLQALQLSDRDTELFFLGLVSDTLHRLLASGLCTAEHTAELQRVGERLVELSPTVRTRRGGLARIMPLVQRLAAGTVEWASPKTKAALQVLLNVYCKRSAFLREGKRELVALLKQDKGDAAAVVQKTIVEYVEDLGRIYPGCTPVVQNLDAVKALDATKLAGDAELQRKPWSTSTTGASGTDRVTEVEVTMTATTTTTTQVNKRKVIDDDSAAAAAPGKRLKCDDTVVPARIVDAILDAAMNKTVAAVAAVAIAATAAVLTPPNAGSSKVVVTPDADDETAAEPSSRTAESAASAALEATQGDPAQAYDVATLAAMATPDGAPNTAIVALLPHQGTAPEALALAAALPSLDLLEVLAQTKAHYDQMQARKAVDAVARRPAKRAKRAVKPTAVTRAPERDGAPFPTTEMVALHSTLRLTDRVNDAVVELLTHWQDPAKGQAAAVAVLCPPRKAPPKVSANTPRALDDAPMADVDVVLDID